MLKKTYFLPFHEGKVCAAHRGLGQGGQSLQGSAGETRAGYEDGPPLLRLLQPLQHVPGQRIVLCNQMATEIATEITYMVLREYLFLL